MENLHEIEQRLMQIIKTNLLIDIGKSEQIPIDSFQLTQLMLEIEDEYNIRLLSDDIKQIASNITVENIALLLEKKLLHT